MRTITTKYFGPTNSKGSRIKATSNSGESLTIPYYSELGFNSHSEAALRLARKLGWQGSIIEGESSKGCVYILSSGTHYKI